MKSFVLLILLSLYACQGGQETRTRERTQTAPSDEQLLHYATHTQRSDPGDFESLYDELPDDLEALCELVKCQLIHPMEALQMGWELEKVSREGEMLDAEDMLGFLMEMDNRGLTCKRKEGDRAVLACYHHALLLASILRERGVPVRLRAGFSRFYEAQAGVRFGHIICEVWDAGKKRWIMADPDRNLVRMKKNDFDFAWMAWENIRQDKLDPHIYTASISGGNRGIVNLLILDASLLVMDEKLYWDLPEVIMEPWNTPSDLNPETMLHLEELARYCKEPAKYDREIRSLLESERAFHSAGIGYETYLEMMLNSR
jgi:hypothetical protein